MMQSLSIGSWYALKFRKQQRYYARTTTILLNLFKRNAQPFLQVGDLQWDLAHPCRAHRWPERESKGMDRSVYNHSSKRCQPLPQLQVNNSQTVTTSCLLISLVEKVLLWWTPRVSDHSVLFLRLVGVGPAALLLALRDIPGDLLSLRNVLQYKRKRKDHNFSITHNTFVELLIGKIFTWIVCPKRRTAPFFEGDIKFTRDDTLASGRTRLLLGSWESTQ